MISILLKLVGKYIDYVCINSWDCLVLFLFVWMNEFV